MGRHGSRATPPWLLWTIVGIAVAVVLSLLMRRLMSPECTTESAADATRETGAAWTTALTAHGSGRSAIPTPVGRALMFWQFGSLADAHGQLL